MPSNMLVMKSWKRQMTERVELTNQEKSECYIAIYTNMAMCEIDI